MKNGIVINATPSILINNLFPESGFPCTVDYMYQKLIEKREILPTRTRIWLSWPIWGNPRNGETERQLATFLDHLGDVLAVITKNLKRRRRWTNRYSAKSPDAGTLKMKRKPDVIAVKNAVFDLAEDGDLNWIMIDLVVELKTTPKTLEDFIKGVAKDLGDRTLIFYKLQENRRFVTYLVFTDTKVYVSHFDRSCHTTP